MVEDRIFVDADLMELRAGESGGAGDQYARACCAHDHVVAFYDTDAYLVEIASAFLGEGLAAGGAAVIVADPGHRDGLRRALGASGLDLAEAERDGRLVVLDAAETLARFMGPVGPDQQRFEEVVGHVLARCAREGGDLRVYGGMVALLWAEGAVAAAIALEDLWNDLAATIDFTLLCAYPMSAFEGPGTQEPFARVCEQHGAVIPSEGYGLAADDEQRRRHYADLEHEVRMLRSSVSAAPAAPPPPPPATTPALADPFTAALIRGDAAAATRALTDRLAAGAEPRSLIVDTITPAMHEIGRAWESGRLSIAGEHLATVTCQRALTDLYPALLSARPRSRERVVVAAVEGELHAVAPRIIGDVLEASGYDVIHLGADVASGTIADTARRVGAPLVALSLTIPENAASLERTIGAVQAALPGVPLLLGGQGMAAFAARGFPVADSAATAVSVAERLLAERPEMPSLAFAAGGGPQAPVDHRLDGVTGRFAAAAEEFGDLARAHALRAHEYRFQAMQDVLTGLPNRRAYDERFERMERANVPGALLIVDVDEFKAINDLGGHEGGDELLRRIGHTLALAVRPGDLVARLGGDEFGILLAEGTEPVDVAEVGERLRAAVEVSCRALGATISVGGAVFAGDRRQTSIAADGAVYAAKRAGRNSVVIASG